MLQPLGDFAGLSYLDFDGSTMLQESWNSMEAVGGYINGLPACHPTLPSLHEIMNPQQSSSVSNSTSDEADGQLYNIIAERKRRRMISNRESARRSRMRKQKHLDELWSQVTRLRTENHALVDQFNRVFENHNQAVRENVKLRDEVSQLRKMVAELQITSPGTFLKDLDEIHCNTDNAEASSNHSISISLHLLD